MACLKIKKRSPYWWIKFRNEHGKTVEQSTGFKIDNTNETRLARALMAEKTAQELRAKPSQTCAWEKWVPAFFKISYASQEGTLEAYHTRWCNLLAFLHKHGLYSPSIIKREHGLAYMDWRMKGDTKLKVRASSHNTARMELKLLALVMNEAVDRGYASVNPLIRLKIAKIPAEEKPELTDEQIQLVRQELQTGQWPKWMGTAFEIALYTGCRLEETNVFLHDVDLNLKRITFRDPKGGRGGNKDYTVPLRDELVPLFSALKSTGRSGEQRAYTPRPEGVSKWWRTSRPWHRFFKSRPEFAGVTFHCTRVTFITRGARAGVSISKMMRLVNHASETIHRIYQRLQIEDLDDDLNKIVLPTAKT